MTTINNHIKTYLPKNWDQYRNGHVLFQVRKGTQEYQDVIKECTTSKRTNVARHQNVEQYASFLVRQQHLQVLNPDPKYITVRRYCKIRWSAMEIALYYNLDYRRLNMLEETVALVAIPPDSFENGEVILVIKCVVRDDQIDEENVQRTSDSDWYIEYIVYF